MLQCLFYLKLFFLSLALNNLFTTFWKVKKYYNHNTVVIKEKSSITVKPQTHFLHNVQMDDKYTKVHKTYTQKYVVT